MSSIGVAGVRPSWPSSHRAAGYAALVGAGVLWGLGFVFGKAALASMPVAAMVTYRFAIASLAVAPLLVWRGIRIRRTDIWVFAVAALLFVPLQFLVAFEGLSLTSVTHASLMVALVPVMVAVASVVLPGAADRPKWVAVGASAVGAVLVVFGPSGNASILGDGLIALSLVVAVAWIMLTERRLQGYDPVAASAAVLWIGTAMLIAFESVAHPHELIASYPSSAWIATIGSGILSTALATVFWNVGLSRVPSADAGLFVNLEPLVGSMCGVAFFGDPLRWPLIAGALLIVGSALVVTRGTRAHADRLPDGGIWPAETGHERTSGIAAALAPE